MLYLLFISVLSAFDELVTLMKNKLFFSGLVVATPAWKVSRF